MEKKEILQQLINYYTDGNKSRFAEMLEVTPQAVSSWMSRNTFDLDRIYSKCVGVSAHWLLTGEGEMIANDKSQSEPYFNIATCYLNQALTLEQLNEPRKYRQQLVKLYTEARPHMEKYRELAPRDIERWGPALYRIYLNLNKGKQFEEIDRLMKRQ